MTYEEKRSRFIAAVRAEAMKQSEHIQSSVEALIESELAKAEEELRRETEAEVRTKINKIRRETGATVSSAQREADAEIYRCRAEIEESVFALVKKKLEKFRQTKEYDAYLAQGAEKLNELFGTDDTVKLYYAPFDEGMLETLKMLIKAKVEATADQCIELGGFRVECAGKRLAVDDTLDTALELQRERLRTIPELRLVARAEAKTPNVEGK